MNNDQLVKKYINLYGYITDLEKLIILYPNENWN